jgi:hypothetical protein
MIGTEADLNDHWMSVIDNVPVISAEIGKGDYAAYIAGQNLGFDQLSLGEDGKLTDAELAARKDLEWYRTLVMVIANFCVTEHRWHGGLSRTEPLNDHVA